MKILLINGSPRGKNSGTLKLAQAFLSGFQSVRQDAELGEITVRDRKINDCAGCFRCWTETPGVCVFKDDMKDICEALVAADVIIWSFPLYYYGMPSRVKALLDRTLPLSLPFIDKRADGTAAHPQRYRRIPPRVVLISTVGFYTLKRNIDALSLQFELMTPEDSLTKIFCPMGELFNQPALKETTDAFLDKVRKAGSEYALSFRVSPETQARLAQPLMPADIFIEMANQSWGAADPRVCAEETPSGISAIADDPAQGENPLNEAQLEALVFTRGMGAAYRADSYQGKERVLEMVYTDLDASFKLIMGAEGCEVVRFSPKAATTRIETPWQVWKDISEGKTEGAAALMKGLYRVRGDFDLMMNWDRFFAASEAPGPLPDKISAAEPAPIVSAKTSFLFLLAPWIVFWAAVPALGNSGAFAAVLAASALPLAGIRARLTVFDKLSALLVGGLSGAILTGVPLPPAIVVSYALFGAMWLASCLLPIPITAYYSSSGHGGDRAFRNPIFMATNRILSAVWGVYYLLAAGFTFFLYRAGLGSVSGLINMIGPILIGAFTAWFQRWYPAKIARG